MLETKIHVYELPYVKLLHSIETAQNARGLCALTSGNSCRIAFAEHGTDDDSSGDALKPSPPTSFSAAAGGSGTVVVFDALRLQTLNVIGAHKTSVAALAINDAGTALASASVRGTVIRVFALPQGTVAFACRRGSYAASISALTFAHDAALLCVASKTGTVHVFNMAAADGGSGDSHLADSTLGERSMRIDHDFGHGSVAGPSAAMFDAYREHGDDGRAASDAAAPSANGARRGDSNESNGAAEAEYERRRHSPESPSALRRPPHLGHSPSSMSESPPAPLLFSAYMAGLWNAASSALEPVRHFAVARLPAVVPVACAFGASGSRGQLLFVVGADGRFFELALDTVRGGEMLQVREHSCILTDHQLRSDDKKQA